MKRLIILSLCSLCMAGCGAHRHLPIQTDSVRVDTKVEYRERLVKDTVIYELPVIVEKRVTDDTLSVIENEYARTAAVVHDGKLSHDLQTKPAKLMIPVEFPVHELMVTTNKAEIRTERIEVKVPRDLTFWEKLKIRAMGWLIGSAIILVGFFAAKVLKKRLTVL